MKYGNAWEQFPIEPNEIWGIPSNGSKVAVYDIFDSLPSFMNVTDLLFVDPPYNQSALNAFYTKAGRDDYQEWKKFTGVLFRRIAEISPTTCYIEIGNQFVDEWQDLLASLYPSIQRWEVVYYRKHPTNILRGGQQPIGCDFTGMDEAKVIAQIGQVDGRGVMGDICMGLGLVGLSAWAAGRPFVGTELNKRRLANLLQSLHKLGAKVERYE